jgi:hypothetical protein
MAMITVGVAILDTALGPGAHADAVAGTILALCPSARILTVPVLDRRGGQGDLVVLADAFGWLAANAARLEIGLVCAALSDGTNRRDDTDLREYDMTRHLAALRGQGVPTVAAAGNGFRVGDRRLCQGMGVPAILRETVSVGALDRDAFRPADRSQRLSLDGACRTTLFAPQAAAYVTGRIAAGMADGMTAEAVLAGLIATAQRLPNGEGGGWPALVDEAT